MQRKLQWQCTAPGCKKSYPPTEKGLQRIRAHVLGGHSQELRGYQLVDAESGEVLAKDLKGAREKGLLEPELPPSLAQEVKPEEKPQPPAPKPPEEPPETKQEEEELEEPSRAKEKAEEENKEITTPPNFY
ncbi:unnamed protein product [marine sediment metagenome]|uniref:Uncharacterized protein n=1 Tax=marine sediment metagenome TaxID=412755 RepID=X1V5H9_9ZZZZ